MLLNAQLSKCYWAETISTATYLNNRSHTRALQGKTPYEAWHSEKPGVDHIRVFGCEHMHISPKMNSTSLTQKPRNVFYLAMGKKPKDTDCMMWKTRKFSTVEISDSMKEKCSLSNHLKTLVVITDMQLTFLVMYIESKPGQPVDPEGTESQQIISPEPQPLKRSTRQKSRPDDFAQQSHLTESPSTYKEVTTSTKKGKWQQAMEAEMKSLEDNYV